MRAAVLVVGAQHDAYGELLGARARAQVHITRRGQSRELGVPLPASMKVCNVVVAATLACVCSASGGPDGAITDQLKAGESLQAEQQLTSGSGKAKFVVQSDGNLVLYQSAQTNTGASDDVVLWASNTHAATGDGLHLDLQVDDGNLVLYSDPQKPDPVVWTSSTSSATELVLQDDCNLVLRDSALNALWTTNTGCHAPGPAPRTRPTTPPRRARVSTPPWITKRT